MPLRMMTINFKVREMEQRKLTDEELQHVNIVRMNIGSICRWGETSLGVDHWAKSARSLDEMFHNATTDGKPWVDPEPPIPEGYRPAVAGDEVRRDVKFWSKDGEWKQRCFVGREFEDGMRYIVPADRTPTDDDAKSRPEVMVRNAESYDWRSEVLVAVISTATYPFYVKGIGGCRQFRQCRHLYPGE